MTSSAAEFLRLTRDTPLQVCIPTFESSGSTPEKYGYRGHMYADRDVRSARHIEHLACQAGSIVELISPDRALDPVLPLESSIVFIGSRSNPATNEALESGKFDDILSFSYGDDWVVETKSGNRYTIPDPSKLDRDTYSKQTDYGVVAYSLGGGSAKIIVAGLGGRATEGCGRFLEKHWEELNDRADGSSSIAVILKFPPPVSPEGYQIVEYVTN